MHVDELTALAERTWSRLWEDVDVPCPADMIPTEDELAHYLTSCAPASVGEAASRLNDLLDGEAWRWEHSIGGGAGMLQARLPSAAGADEVLSSAAVHAAWLAAWDGTGPKHPMAPIITSWQDRPHVVAPARSPRRILPNGFRYATLRRPESTPEGMACVAKAHTPAPLPSPETATNAIVPPLPLLVGDANRAGRTAPLAARLWFEVVLAVGRIERERPVVQLHIPLKEIVGWLWPYGWHRTRDLPRLIQALEELHNLRIEYQRREWLLVAVRALPTRATKLNDIIVFDCFAIPDNTNGPMISVGLLRQFGVKSGVAWRAWIRLAYIWDAAKGRNGGHRVYPTRPAVLRGPDGGLVDQQGMPLMARNGNPLKDWSDPRAVRTGEQERNPALGRLPVLATPDLAVLGFDDRAPTIGASRTRASETRKWLRYMANLGVVTLEWEGDSVRVIETPRAPDAETV